MPQTAELPKQEEMTSKRFVKERPLDEVVKLSEQLYWQVRFALVGGSGIPQRANLAYEKGDEIRRFKVEISEIMDALTLTLHGSQTNSDGGTCGTVDREHNRLIKRLAVNLSELREMGVTHNSLRVILNHM